MSFNAFFHEVAAEVRNWGRWGDDDRIGTLNLLTDDAVAAAAATVTTGHRVPLAVELRNDGLQMGQIPTRINPIHVMGTIDHPDLGDPDGEGMVPHFSDDMVTMGLQAGTHWDGLSHVSYGHQLYNGVPASTVTARGGAETLGIEHVTRLAGRGVLLDIAGAKGLERLPDAHEITGADLDEAAEWGKVSPRSGDIVLLRTGRMQLYVSGGAQPYTLGEAGGAESPGPGFDAVRWFHRHDVAAAATDTYMFEVFPGPEWDNVLGVHCLDVVEMGLTQGQNFNLEELAGACIEHGRHEFLLVANPEPFRGATGAPVSPLAIF